MKCIKIIEPGIINLEDIPLRKISDFEVLIKIRRIGLCGSDLNTFKGINPLTKYPIIPGHEISGEIVDIGNNVKGVSIGDQVVVLPCTECHQCSSCTNNRPNACENNQTLGVQRNGGLSEFIILPFDKIIVCNQLGYDELAIVEPMAVGYHAAYRAAIKSEELVMIIGCGAIGLGAIVGAKSMGAIVIAVDLDESKEAVARECGADYFINSSNERIVLLKLKKLGINSQPMVVIEAVGNKTTFLEAISIVSFSGRVIYVGYAKGKVSYNTSLFVMKELDIRGSRNATLNDFNSVINLMKKKKYPVQKIITRKYPLEDSKQAFITWANDPKGIIKLLINLD